MNITDDSKYKWFIPYRGWKVKGKWYLGDKSMEQFISFPITSDNTKVEFVFSHKGRVTGAVLTLISSNNAFILSKRLQKEITNWKKVKKLHQLSANFFINYKNYGQDTIPDRFFYKMTKS